MALAGLACGGGSGGLRRPRPDAPDLGGHSANSGLPAANRVAADILGCMTNIDDSGKVAEPALTSPYRRRWDLFEAICGDRVRADDAAWAAALSPAERLAVADDLLTTIRAVRVAAGDWEAVDNRAWCETLAERDRQVAAFRRLDEVTHGTGPVADAG